MATKSKRRELILSVKATAFRSDDPGAEHGDEEFHKVRKRVLEKDNYTCQYCGFRCGVDNGNGSGSWMEVHHIDDNHNNNSMSNLATICQFCHNCQHIGFAGLHDEASLIWLPEIEQWELHHIVRTCMVAKGFKQSNDAQSNQRNKIMQRTSDVVNTIFEQSEAIMAMLSDRRQQAQDILGTDNPKVLGDALGMLPTELYDKRADLLGGIRLFPKGVRKKDGGNLYETAIVPTWMSATGPYHAVPPATWLTFAQSIKK